MILTIMLLLIDIVSSLSSEAPKCKAYRVDRCGEDIPGKHGCIKFYRLECYYIENKVQSIVRDCTDYACKINSNEYIDMTNCDNWYIQHGSLLDGYWWCYWDALNKQHCKCPTTCYI